MDIGQLRRAVREAGLAGQCLCAHSSLRSFGHVEGDAASVVAAFLEEGCTFMVPTFSYDFMLKSQPGMRPARNAWTYDSDWDRQPRNVDRVFTPECNEIAADMGAIPRAVLAMPSRVRGDHPLCSFAAVGLRAKDLVAGQQPMDVYAPLEALAGRRGSVVLMGVGLDRLTLLHLAEKRAGRRLFIRWANGPQGRPMTAEFGSCSEGFEKLRPALAPLIRVQAAGPSRWEILPAAEALNAAAANVRANPSITHCGKAECERCRDAVAGGPIVE